MKSITRKTILASIVLAIMLVGSGILLLLQNNNHSKEKYLQNILPDLKYVAQGFQELRNEEYYSLEWFRENQRNNLLFMKTALGKLTGRGAYTGPRTFQDGVVAELKGDRVIFPEGTPESLLTLSAETIRSEADTCLQRLESADLTEFFESSIIVSFPEEDGDGQNAWLSVIPITQDDYYIDWTFQSELDEYIATHGGAQKLMEEAEESYDGAFIVLDSLMEDSDWLTPIYRNDENYLGQEDPAELEKQLNELIGTGEHLGSIDLGYLCAWDWMPEGKQVLVYLTPQESLRLSEAARVFVLLLILLLILVSLIVYLTSVQQYVQKPRLSAEIREEYSPRKTLHKVLSAGLAGALVMFAIGAFFQSIGTLQEQTLNGKRQMESMLDKILQNQEESFQNRKQEEEAWYVYYGEQMAYLISEYPQLEDKDVLQEFCDALQIDYIMLFDSYGRETVCNLDYSNFNLGTGQGVASSDFRRLLQGVPSIVHEPSVDSVTGLERQIIGVTIPEESNVDPHRALIMALLPERTQRTGSEKGIDGELAALAGEGEFYFGADSKTGEILYSSQESFIGGNITNYQLPEESLIDGYMGYGRIDGERYYIITAVREKIVYYYALAASLLFSDVLAFALLTVGLYALMYLVLVWILLAGYKEPGGEAEDACGEEALPETDVPLDASDVHMAGYLRKWRTMNIRWSQRLPEEKTKAVFSILLFIETLLLYAYEISGITKVIHHGESLFRFILFGEWMRGCNLFAVCGILVLTAAVFLAVTVLKWILRFLQIFLGNRGDTVCKLLYSLTNYLAVLVVLYCSLEYLGLSPGTILAGLGIAGVAVSLGAKDMITDIFAGISLVFEDAFKVGDFITIDGYRGQVESIGIRMTRIVVTGGNVRIVNNKDVRNVINHNKRNSEARVYIKISGKESLPRVRAILEEHLPALGEKNDLIIDGPFYRGVSDPRGALITIMVAAACLEEDIYTVTFYLNEEVYNLLREEGVSMQLDRTKI